MKKCLLATTLLAAMAAIAPAPAMAQSTPAANAPVGNAPVGNAPVGDAPVGKAAGTFMVRGRIIGVLPLDSTSSISVIGGKVETSNAVTPEVDFSYFLTDNIAVELIAATSRHDLYAVDSALGGKTKVGRTWVLPPTLLLQYHFFPKERFSPYAGVGLNLSFFYGTSAANGINQVAMSNSAGVAIQAGFDYNFSGNWFANFDVKQIFVSTKASINGGAIRATTALNPTVIGAGIGYRF